ncbi:cytosine deaminase [Dissoconium aciculare CBS 342.82]|uniref:Cytosine deaminase n=1 Tax=Dissoconium aciculare CBS 342.82 TaxID=1314786 RepID=A0A6J3LZB2_9PEZI|nr:cytosine deaminase [Dissoconium aciculare CBS 342.82]KAF1819977.1 cytosine deaminase [Dissoconium aciculare CBS 342.82]
MSVNDEGARIAFEEAEAGLAEGGIPVGSAIVGSDGKILGRGRNLRVQNGSPILHGETAAFDSARHLRNSDWKGATLYTTLSPCPMCAGAMVLFGIKKVVIAENSHMSGREEFLRSHGMEVVVLNDQKCVGLLNEFIEKYPEHWEF